MSPRAIDQFRKQHGREPEFFGVVDMETQRLVSRKPTARAAQTKAKQHSLLSEHRTSWLLEDSVMLGYFTITKR